MIEVKSLRRKENQRSAQNPYEEPKADDKAKRPRMPLKLTLALAAVALYLKSFLPASAAEDAAPGAKRAHAPEADDGSPVAAGRALPPDRPEEDPRDRHPDPGAPERPAIASRHWVQVQPGDSGLSANRNAPPPPPGPDLPAGHIRDLKLPPVVFPGIDNPGPGPEGPEIDIDINPDPEDDDQPGPLPPRNRPPRNNGQVYLNEMTSTAVLLILFHDLLSRTTDADGDTLTVRNVTASAGRIEPVEGGVKLTLDGSHAGPLVLDYEVFDGRVAVAQRAQIAVVEAPVTGTDGADMLHGTMASEAFHAGGGDDRVDAGAGHDILHGGDGNDTLSGGDGNDHLFGGAGHDILSGGNGNDRLSGGDGNDHLFGDAGDDLLFGDAGDDMLDGGDGDDVLDGGDGNDSLSGGSGNDMLDGGDGNDALDGGDGADSLAGGSGDDLLSGGGGNDALDGGDGADSLAGGSGDDMLSGGTGNDVLDGGDGADALAGGDGNDTLDGGAGNDVLDGGDGADILAGGDGDDLLQAGAGDDTVDGGAGDDLVLADAGDDRLSGGAGHDELDYSAATLSVVVDLALGTVTSVEFGSDTIDSFESFVGGSGNDLFLAGAETATFTGGAGSDGFVAVASAAAALVGAAQAGVASQRNLFHVTDFDVGDYVGVNQHRFFKKLVDDIEDRLEDHFELVYGKELDCGDALVRYRQDMVDNVAQTVVEIDFDRDAVFETTVTLNGTHALVMFDKG